MNPLRRALSLSVLCATSAAILLGPGGAAAAGGKTTVKTLTSRGEARVYRVFKPAGLKGRAPLIVALHGAGGSGAKFERHSGWDGLAQRVHVLVAYPNSFTRGWRNNGQVDVQFLSSMLDAIERDYKVDRRRVYFTGFSSGAFMTYRVACDLASRVPAIGPVAGAPVRDCAPAPLRPVAVIHIHGTADARVPYLGGQAIANGQPFGQAFPSALAMSPAMGALGQVFRQGHVGAPGNCHHQDVATLPRWDRGPSGHARRVDAPVPNPSRRSADRRAEHHLGFPQAILAALALSARNI